jgi:hypothetical protein
VYQASPAAAALVKALLRAKGNWKSSSQLASEEPELEGVRLDRLRLPEPIQGLIEKKPGAGYRLKVEELE